ncbi:Integral membrane protein YggT, involved in response to extracytoplasmic stress (osmotic shock) [Dissulfuribacter thermophilus]|uniref:Integral membrane protein YggT, involved in response to extracytoplasmic stress (Osmotic shock) n=1 Tax=Dissulfuribacter thermophilus TaxID=1156395 RepID=A0A1B9F741_9BACT|nr:YggT family protein [Dissulfuribacter thermophilus]OCC15703.1 Integral membrane protein YggT, involved in response to extracytoplasmic stress (osmotic shock) [Dissulfuribacter thermophilus]
MFILANFLNALASVIDMVLSLYIWIVIVQALISWVNPDPFNPIVRFLYQVTEPVFYRVRRILPLQFGGIDLTPMVVIIAIVFIKSFLVTTLHQLAYRLV